MSHSFIGVICGLKSEAAAVRDAVKDKRLRIGVSGANAARAEQLATTLCHEGAGAIISVGVSGGLDPALAPGDLVIGNLIIADDGAVWECHSYLNGAIRDAALDAGARTGALFGADAIIENTSKKSALFHNHGALAVDMESHGAAKAAAAAGVPFLAIRAIADPADRALPPAALNAVAEDGSTRTLATLGAALRDPKQFPALMKLGKDSEAALNTLRRDLGLFFDRLFLSLDL